MGIRALDCGCGGDVDGRGVEGGVMEGKLGGWGGGKGWIYSRRWEGE